MRVMLKVNMPVARANALVREGKLGSTIQAIVQSLKPEAAYFTDSNGQRTGFLFLDLKDSSEIPRIAEPWFLALDAAVEIHPVMAPADLAKAAPFMDEAAKKYG